MHEINITYIRTCYCLCILLATFFKNNFSHAGLATDKYKYYNPETCMFDPEGAYSSLKVRQCVKMCDNNVSHFALQSLPENSLVLFHACAHNPTGADPSPEHWAEISQICKVRKCIIRTCIA